MSNEPTKEQKTDYSNTVCKRLYLPVYGVEERCHLGFNNSNQCVAGHPWCKEYRAKGGTP